MKTTQAEFWAVLARCKGFRIAEGGTIQTDKRICPVCAVANKLLRTDKWQQLAYSAALEIGLDPRFVDRVVSAADYPNPGNAGHLRLREKLLSTLKLTEKTK